ncbi:MAG TPA: hypothetical protein VE994_13995 [Terriglobales bacterium]|nr:hypothetical protein [Terriglobales bacterium]
MSGLLVSITVFLTVVLAMIVGIAGAYGAVTGILIAFGHHSQTENVPATLTQIESRASGD